MHTFQAAAAAFALACICAETVTLLVNGSWAHRCIKALAGIYILIVLLRLVPAAGKSLDALPGAELQPVSLPGLETQILSETERQLETELEASCQEKFGVSLTLEIVLAQDGTELRAVQVRLKAPAGSSPSACRNAADYLRGELGVDPELEIEEGTGA